MALETLYKFYTALDSLVMSRQLGSIADYGICSWGINKPKIDGSNTLVLSAGTSFLVKGYSADPVIGESLQTTLFKVTETSTADPIFSCAGQEEPCIIALEYEYTASVDYGPRPVWCYLERKGDSHPKRLEGYEPAAWVSRFKNKTLIPIGKFIPPKDPTSDVGTLYTEGYALYAKEYFKTTLPYYFRYTIQEDAPDEPVSPRAVSLYYGSELVTTKDVLQKISATEVSWTTLDLSTYLKSNDITKISEHSPNYAGFRYKVDAFRFPDSDEYPAVAIDISQNQVDKPHYFKQEGYLYIADLFFNNTNDSQLLGLNSIFYSDFTSFLPGGGSFELKDTSGSDISTEGSEWSKDFQTLNLNLTLGTGVVSNSNISNGAITANKLTSISTNVQTLPSNWKVSTSQLTDSIGTAKLADGSVTESKLATDSVTTAKVKDASITTSKLSDSSVTTAKVADNSITTSKIKNSEVTVDKMTFTATSGFSPTTGKIWIS